MRCQLAAPGPLHTPATRLPATLSAMQVDAYSPCIEPPPPASIVEFCVPLLAGDNTGEVWRAIREFATRFRTNDLKRFVLFLLNDKPHDPRRNAVRHAMASMCAAKGWPLRHVQTEDEAYYDFYNEPYFCWQPDVCVTVTQ